MKHRTNSARLAAGLSLVALALAACTPQSAGSTSGAPSEALPPPPPPPPPPPAPPRYPTIGDAAITPATSRPLGVFATEADAVAAARAAGLAPGVFGLAMVGGQSLAITAAGEVFLRAQTGNTPNMSGPAQRPPQ